MPKVLKPIVIWVYISPQMIHVVGTQIVVAIGRGNSKTVAATLTLNAPMAQWKGPYLLCNETDTSR